MAETAVAVTLSLLVLGCGYALGTRASLPLALAGLLALLVVAEATIGIPSGSSVPVSSAASSRGSWVASSRPSGG